MKALLLFLFLNGVCFFALGQEADFAPVPRWRAGIDISQPVLLQFDNFAGWDRAMQLEGLLQYRLGKRGYVWPQLYAGYFGGNNEFKDGSLKQKGAYVKPGISLHFSPKSLLNPFLEVSALYSQGRLAGSARVYDPVFGDAEQEANQVYNGGGALAGFGFFPYRIGPYPFRVSAWAFVGGYGGVEKLNYLPGAGRVPGFIMYFNLNVRLYLLREW